MCSKEEMLKTIVVTVNISDSQFEWLKDKSSKCGLCVDELMAEFMEDLITDKYCTNIYQDGDGERWVERSGFVYNAQETLLGYLHREGCFEEFMRLLADIEMEKELLEMEKISIEPDEEYIQDSSNWLKKAEQKYEEIIKEFLDLNPRAKIKDELEDCFKWKKEMDKIFGEVSEVYYLW